MGKEGGEGASIIGPDELWRRRNAKVEREMQKRRVAEARAQSNEVILSDKKEDEAAKVEWQHAHDAAVTALHEHEVYFRDEIKTARHEGKSRIEVRILDDLHDMKAHTPTYSRFGKLFAECDTDAKFAAVAQAIEHWLAGQQEKLGNVWVEYDETPITDIQEYYRNFLREAGKMAIVWQAKTTPDSPAS